MAGVRDAAIGCGSNTSSEDRVEIVHAFERTQCMGMRGGCAIPENVERGEYESPAETRGISGGLVANQRTGTEASNTNRTQPAVPCTTIGE